MLAFLANKNFLLFLGKFILVFLLCYYGTLAVIGLTAKEGGYYSAFISNYLDYVSWIRESLLYGSKFVLGLFGVQTYLASQYNLRMVNGRGIIIVYECVGYGIMSFWTAFIVASSGAFKRKFFWWASGILIFWLLNVSRLSLLLVATNKNWAIPFGWDHHTWFNMIAYIAIIIMIYFFEKKSGGSKNSAYADKK